MKTSVLATAIALALPTSPVALRAAPTPVTSTHPAPIPAYFSADPGMKVERDGQGVLVATFNTKGVALTSTAKDHTDFVDATRAHCIQPLKERIVHEISNGLSLEGASASDLVKTLSKSH
jgi:hypothetical protein